MTVGDYVTEFSAAQDPAFDPFDSESVSWEKDFQLSSVYKSQDEQPWVFLHSMTSHMFRMTYFYDPT